MLQALKINLLIATFLIGITSCEVVPDPPIELNHISRCHREVGWDEAAIENHLIGTWQWRYVAYSWTPDKNNSHEFKDLTLVFKTKRIVEVYEKEELMETLNYTLSDESYGVFRFSAYSYEYPLSGDLLFCQDKMVLSNSSVDGNDNYFKKIE